LTVTFIVTALKVVQPHVSTFHLLVYLTTLYQLLEDTQRPMRNKGMIIRITIYNDAGQSCHDLH